MAISGFLAIEGALNDRLLATWRPLAAEIYAKMRAAIRDGDFDRAREIAFEIDMSPVGKENREWIKYLFYAAGKYGARNCNPTGQQAFTVGSHDRALDRCVDAFQQWLENKATTDMYQTAVQLIAQAEEAYRAEVAQKGDKPGHEFHGNQYVDAWEHTGATPGTVVSVRVGDAFSGRNEYYLAKGGQWHQVEMPTLQAGRSDSTITPNGKIMSDADMAKSSPSLVREATGELTHLYDLEALPTGAEVEWNGKTYTKTESGWKHPSGDTFDVKFMDGVVAGGAGKARRVKSETHREACRKADKRFVRDFVSFADDGDARLQMVSALHTSRLSTWGFVAEAEVLGVTRYKLETQLDNRTSPFCRHVATGREFEVKNARRKVNEVLSVEDDEQLREVQPWPDQDAASIAEYAAMSDEELVQRGLHIPPFHPWCRTILVRADTGEEVPTPDEGEDQVVPPDEATSVLPEETTAVTDQTFDEMEQDATADDVEQWNQLMGMLPADALSKLTGFGVAALLSGEVRLGDLFGRRGLFRFNAEGEVGGGTMAVDTTFDTERRLLRQNYIDFEDVAPEVAAERLSEVYSGTMDVAERIAAQGIETHLDADNARAMLRAGFLPETHDWNTLRADALRRLERGETPKGWSETQVSEVRDLLNSTDPKALWALADLRYDAMEALGDLDLDAVVDVADAAAVDRYRSVFG